MKNSMVMRGCDVIWRYRWSVIFLIFLFEEDGQIDHRLEGESDSGFLFEGELLSVCE